MYMIPLQGYVWPVEPNPPSHTIPARYAIYHLPPHLGWNYIFMILYDVYDVFLIFMISYDVYNL